MEGEAKRSYRQYVKKGLEQGRRPELVGGGLIRSLGGWSQLKAMRKLTGHERSDERILGSGDFVEQVIRQADEQVKHQFSIRGSKDKAERLIAKTCRKAQISVEALRTGSRRRDVSKARAELAGRLVGECGFTLAEIARWLGVSTSAIAKSLSRREA